MATKQTTQDTSNPPDPHYTIREASAITNVCVDTIRRRYHKGLLKGAGPRRGDITGTVYVPHTALVAAGLLVESVPAPAPGVTPDYVGNRQEVIALRARRESDRERIAHLEAEVLRMHTLVDRLASALVAAATGKVS